MCLQVTPGRTIGSETVTLFGDKPLAKPLARYRCERRLVAARIVALYCSDLNCYDLIDVVSMCQCY